MSDETNSGVAEAVEEQNENSSEQSGTVAMIDKGGFVLDLESIDEGQGQGFKFYVPKFKTLDFVIDHFTNLSKGGKDGADIVLGLVNSALRARMRSKANSLITLNSTNSKTVTDKQNFLAQREEWRKDPVKSILVDETEASEYVPGERETSSLSGLIKQRGDLLKSIKSFKDAGEIDKAKAQKAKYLEVIAQIEALQKAQDEEVLAALD